ncbi:S1-like domain-containing RNA-binding protein [Gramella sp. GC03-9]|uniref:S1-like domain-containing RNA-binding protein n=1 Tax=Christiangramia oceanisediminis TaxID=2920386 RepID=A0A9X2KXH1_9FLAO|nr:S1-like domain-containing RNA-binding protein [Gramella oceanisediminis]MCP9199846.1 S1-like domain-containing RNA-binding protein [Gramella oceanisediminis]
MIQLGDFHELIMKRSTDFGVYLENQEGDEVLLPNKYVPENWKPEELISVFVYLDHEERPVATTLEPKIKLDEFGTLQCVDVNKYGAFLDWGLEKHLFVPFKEQVVPMQKGEEYLVFCYLDLETERLAASSKVHAFLDNSTLTVEPFEEIELIISNKTELGYNVIINGLHLGLLYEDEVFKSIKEGDRVKGWVKKIRSDNKIDVVLQRPGYRSIEPNAQKVLDRLKDAGGFLDLSDKSDPQEIQDRLQMSKKSFKRAAGSLYKQRMIEIKEDGIHLKDQ